MDVDLRHLEAFVAAARHSSFTRAARTLNVSQPAFTVQIRQLESALGVRLLDRNTRSVQLTQIGQDLAPVLERILRELEALLHSTRSLSTAAAGYVAVAALPSLSATILPRIVEAFRKENPAISIHLRDAVGIRVAAMVRAGEADFGFGSLSSADPELEFTPLFKDRLVAIFGPETPFGRRRALSLADLAQQPLILMDRESTVRTVVDRALASIGHYAPPAFEASYMSTALGMVKAGLGVTILPESVLEMEDNRDLDFRPIQKPALDRDVGILMKRGRSLAPAAAALVDAVRKECKSRARGVRGRR